MEDNAIVLSNESALVPAMHYADAQRAYQVMKEFVSSVLKEGTDYGVIPGTEKKDGKPDKKTLLKPGAEKLARFFGLSARFEITKEIEQWDDENAFFYYRHKCILSRISDGAIIAEGEGSCNSHEKKYRWRNAERICPSCGKATIIKGKEEFGGGWLCWKKNGGCGAKFQTGDMDIDGQEVGKIENPDIADVANTILKQSKKRSFVDGVLLACNASEYFSQDIEDLDYGVQVVTVKPDVDESTGEIREETPKPEGANQSATARRSPKRPMEPQALCEFIVSQAMGDNEPCLPERAKKLAIKWGNILHHTEATRRAVAHWLLDWPQDEPIDSFKRLSAKEVDVLDRWLTSDPPSAREEAAAIVALLFTEPKEAVTETLDDHQSAQSTLDAFFTTTENGKSEAYQGMVSGD